MEREFFRMERTEFRFSYEPENGSHEMDAYDAAQALVGIARSLSITTHYAMNGSIIKQAPSLKKAQVLIRPPQPGSFEFIAPVIQFAEANPTIAGIAIGVFTNYLTDLTKLVYRRLTGQTEQPGNRAVEELLRRKPGDISALADAIDEDVAKIHRPFIGQIVNLTITGGTNNFGAFNQSTREYSQAKIVSRDVKEFTGNVASYNANSSTGRFFVHSLGRTIGFKPGDSYNLLEDEKRLLAWSLNEYTNNRQGILKLRGKVIQTRDKTVKQVLIDYVEMP